MTQLYDEIGDPRIAAAISEALGTADPVVNVGAGAGSYELADRDVVALEPAWTMIRQRHAGRARVVQASATHLPFRDAAFAAALAVLTGAGVARLRRDLEDGSWVRRHGDLLTLTELDLGYRLVVARRAAAPEEARS